MENYSTLIIPHSRAIGLVIYFASWLIGKEKSVLPHTPCAFSSL